MGGDVLSQTEVESLLSAMAAGAEEAAAAAVPVAEAQGDYRPTAPVPREKITHYDFKRPERVGKEQMRSLQTLHEGFGRNFGAALSALGTPLQIFPPTVAMLRTWGPPTQEAPSDSTGMLSVMILDSIKLVKVAPEPTMMVPSGVITISFSSATS